MGGSCRVSVYWHLACRRLTFWHRPVKLIFVNSSKTAIVCIHFPYKSFNKQQTENTSTVTVGKWCRFAVNCCHIKLIGCRLMLVDCKHLGLKSSTVQARPRPQANWCRLCIHYQFVVSRTGLKACHFVDTGMCSLKGSNSTNYFLLIESQFFFKNLIHFFNIVQFIINKGLQLRETTGLLLF